MIKDKGKKDMEVKSVTNAVIQAQYIPENTILMYDCKELDGKTLKIIVSDTKEGMMVLGEDTTTNHIYVLVSRLKKEGI